MFGSLTDKLQGVLGRLLQQKQLTSSNIAEASMGIKEALLEADVHLQVVDLIVDRVSQRAVGLARVPGVEPGQQFAKVVFDELVQVMGQEETAIKLAGDPHCVMLCGLQGAGKTTTAGKLAAHWAGQGKRVFLVACDLQRPAAVEQLWQLSRKVEAGFYGPEKEGLRPIEVARKGLELAKIEGYDVIIFDTAGRLHVDSNLMAELQQIKAAVRPANILLVASAAQGQDSLRSAEAFNQAVGLTGSIITMLDGTARAGVAVSLKELTKVRIFYEGVGERIEDIRPFNPTSMAHRVLGMGDTINLVRAAEQHISQADVASLGEKVMSGGVTYNDFLQQMGLVSKLGSLKGVMKMLPAGMMGGLSADQLDKGEQTMKVYRSIIQSMTPAEREEKVELTPSRRARIARGAGVHQDQVGKLIQGFKQMKQMMKKMPSMGMLGKMMGGLRWP